MVRITILRRATLVLACTGGLALVAPAAAAPPPPPSVTVEDAAATGTEVQLQAQVEALLCTLLSPLCGLIDGDGEGEEGSSMDPFGRR